MADTTLNGLRVVNADADLPPEGAWTADVVCDLGDSAEIPSSGTLRLLGLDYRGTVVRGDLVGGTCYLRLVGGAGGLRRQLAPKAYRNTVAVGAVLQDIAREAGETLASTSDPQLLAQTLARWTRVEAPARDQLAHLLQHAGATWRILPSGELWAGRYTWLEAAPAPQGAVLTGAEPGAGRREVAAEEALWQPGQTLQGWRIGAVRHLVRPEKARTILVEWQEGLSALVQGELRRAGYPFTLPLVGRAVVQDADGTLQVQPDDTRWPAQVGVPIRLGIPGSSARVAPGARVVLEWEGPESPVVTAWASSTCQELQVGGAVPVALLGSTVDLGYLVLTPGVSGITAVAYLPPGSPPAPPPAITLPMNGGRIAGACSPLLKTKGT